MKPQETLTFDGRGIKLEWNDSETFPEGVQVSQVTGYCVNDDGQLLLVKNKRGWGFPGGHPEGEETVLETLHRELREEANAEIEPVTLIGYMEVNDPQNDGVEGKHYLQLRYLAKIVKLHDWSGEFETDDRMFAPIEDIPQHVSWVTSPTGSAQMETLSRHLTGKGLV